VILKRSGRVVGFPKVSTRFHESFGMPVSRPHEPVFDHLAGQP
jgi:hypothetical protein